MKGPYLYILGTKDTIPLATAKGMGNFLLLGLHFFLGLNFSFRKRNSKLFIEQSFNRYKYCLSYSMTIIKSVFLFEAINLIVRHPHTIQNITGKQSIVPTVFFLFFHIVLYPFKYEITTSFKNHFVCRLQIPPISIILKHSSLAQRYSLINFQ